MGIEQEWVTDKELQRNPGGIGLMGTLDTDANGNDIVMTDYFWTGGGYDIKEHANRTSAFVQDTWTINDRLTLRPGIRLEQQKANAFGHSTLWNTKTVAPRFGVTYALTADQRNLLKFHWGRFYSAFSASYIDRQYPEMAPAEVQYKWGDPANGYSSVQIDPRNYASWPMPGDPATWVHQATVSSYSVTDPDAKQPYMDETTLSLEHKFKGPWTASATYLYRVNKDNLLRKDVAADSGSSVVEDFDDYRSGQAGTVSVPVWYSSVASDAHQWVVTNIPEAKRALLVRHTGRVQVLPGQLEPERQLHAGRGATATPSRATATIHSSRIPITSPIQMDCCRASMMTRSRSTASMNSPGRCAVFGHLHLPERRALDPLRSDQPDQWHPLLHQRRAPRLPHLSQRESP